MSLLFDLRLLQLKQAGTRFEAKSVPPFDKAMR